MPNTTEQYVDLNGLTIYDGEMKDYIDDSVVQSNWNESDSTSKAYIQNKPTNLVYSEDASGQITVNNDPYAAMSKIAKIYSSTDTYFPGDVVYKDGNLYRVKTTTITPGTWSSSYVEQIYEIGSLPFRAERIIYNAVGIPNDYNETVSYSVGDYCYYPPRMESQYSLMYRCTADTSGVFDGSKWIGTTAFHEQLDGSRKMCDASGSALNVGSSSFPVYFSNGVPTRASVNNFTPTFISDDVADDDVTIYTGWGTVKKLTSGLSLSTLFSRISQMFRNVRWLYKMLGTTDISTIGNGTVTGAISSLNTSLPKFVDIQLSSTATSTTIPAFDTGNPAIVYNNPLNLPSGATVKSISMFTNNNAGWVSYACGISNGYLIIRARSLGGQTTISLADVTARIWYV